jgi:uncharacterized coiled-coil DUF342 family protein
MVKRFIYDVCSVMGMGLKERKEEAEAVLDSAEMTLETFGSTGKKARELEGKIAELEQELQEPDSESSLKKLINNIRDLMDEVQKSGDEFMADEPGPSGPGGMPDDEMPPM